MKRFFLILTVVATLVAGTTIGASAQDILPTPFFTQFADTMIASTFNGEPLVVGTVIKAYDPSGVYCGTDTVRLDGGTGSAIFGYFPVYGDDAGTAGVDEGAEDGEQITFRINGHLATVTDGDDTWTNQSLKSVTLAATATIAIGLTGAEFPADTLILPGDTVQFQARVRNDGDGLDFYGVKLSMSVAGGTGPFNWQAYEPDTVVYAEAGELATVYFTVRAPSFHADTVNTIAYTIFSHLDTTVSITGEVDMAMSLTDVDDDPNTVLPGTFALFQNYPNPFNPTTTIAYQLAVGSTARLDIIDMLGRTVESVELGWLSAGPGQVGYDASGLASGIYLYRLVTDSAAKSRKMILLK